MNSFIGLFIAITMALYAAFFTIGGWQMEHSWQIQTETDRISATIAYSRIALEIAAVLWIISNIMAR